MYQYSHSKRIFEQNTFEVKSVAFRVYLLQKKKKEEEMKSKECTDDCGGVPEKLLALR